MQVMNGLDKASPERSRLPSAGDVVLAIVGAHESVQLMNVLDKT